ncbi:MAG TPA: DNA topology modulation protein [Pyrinomonadaceae bacterium]|jgi:adenylate kinase family enzyme|nr:DNA topology modulation protein [Pyrinomonadaceae bacterium]
MKKILVIGSGGAGKSIFARRLGAILRLEVIHLDSLYWSAGWVEMPKDEWKITVEALLKKDSWIMDGNYGGTLDLRLAASDTLIFLDIPRSICLWRVLKRRALYRKESRPDMADGCPERITWQFIKWIWDYPRKRRPALLEKLKSSSHSKTIIVLRSQTKIESFLANQRTSNN